MYVLGQAYVNKARKSQLDANWLIPNLEIIYYSDLKTSVLQEK